MRFWASYPSPPPSPTQNNDFSMYIIDLRICNLHLFAYQQWDARLYLALNWKTMWSSTWRINSKLKATPLGKSRLHNSAHITAGEQKTRLELNKHASSLQLLVLWWRECANGFFLPIARHVLLRKIEQPSPAGVKRPLLLGAIHVTKFTQ